MFSEPLRTQHDLFYIRGNQRRRGGTSPLQNEPQSDTHNINGGVVSAREFIRRLTKVRPPHRSRNRLRN